MEANGQRVNIAFYKQINVSSRINRWWGSIQGSGNNI